MKILTIHGIRRKQKWYEEFKDLPIWEENNIEVINFEYGYFSLLQFLNPRSRAKVLKKFQQFYSNNFDPKKPPSVVCHSFGSYIFFSSIKKYQSIKFDKVILCGSILSEKTEWREFFVRNQIRFLYNDYGKLDAIVRFSAYVIKGCGKSGQTGFQDIPSKYKDVFVQKNNYFEHSDYFLEIHMRESWANILLPGKKFNYKKLILRNDVIERVYTNISSQDIEYSKIEYYARIDEKGNYYARYNKTGINKSDMPISRYQINTTADATHSGDDMCFNAFDGSGNRLMVTQTEDHVQYKSFNIHFNSTIKKNENFSIKYMFRWKETINKSGDTDHFEINKANNILVTVNFKTKLKSPKFFVLEKKILVDELQANYKTEIDGTHSYTIEYINDANRDGIIFYFEGSDMVMKQGARILRRSKGSKTTNPYQIIKCTNSDIRDVYRIETEVELSNAASESTLKQRMSMFNDGFLVAKENNKVVGYIESLIWNTYDFTRFEEIKDFPVLYDQGGDELYIIFLAVKESYRKNGIGMSLLSAIEDVAIKYGVRWLKLVAKDDLVAYYKKSGFHEIKELPDFLPNREYKSTLMGKFLDNR